MSSSPLSRPVTRVLSVTAISVVLVSISLAWASRQQAGSPSFKSARNHSSRALFADKGVVTPEAVTITVNSLADAANGSDGLCTLREAITAANNNAASGGVAGECSAGSISGSDLISITSVTGTIDLTGALPDITSDMTITGPGSGQLTVRRNTGGNYRIFTNSGGTVTISGLTVTNGRTPDGATTNIQGSPSDGGGIRNECCGTLTLNDLVVSNNRSGDGPTGPFGSAGGDGAGGGGIANVGTLIMTNSSVTGNTAGTGGLGSSGGAGGDGGGVLTFGSLTMTNCTVSGNHAGTGGQGPNAGRGGYGGGISTGSVAGDNTLTNLMVSNNFAGEPGVGAPPSNSTVPNFGGGAGGGIAIRFTGVTATTISNSTISGNHSGSSIGWGGGVYASGNVTVAGSTINNNVATTGGGMYLLGGQVFNTTVSGNSSAGGAGIGGVSSFLTNCTITGNTGSAAVISNGSGAITVRNTIIGANDIPKGDVQGNFTSLGHNLIGDRTTGGGTGFTDGVNGDQVGNSVTVINPQLGPLANNGGPTMTHAPLAASTVLDAGDSCVAVSTHCGDANTPFLQTDQRGTGFARSADGPDVDTLALVDIGAYEMQTALASLPDTSTNEDTQLLVAFDGGDTSTITSVTATSSDPAVVPNDLAHLSVAITGSTGIVTINPATNSNGPTNITITINRTGGPESRTFLLTVNPINDAPSFTRGADQTVNEDAGAQNVNNWATAISAGPANESGQALTFQVTGNTNAALFSAGPAVSSSGTLTYTPAANANGSAIITLNLKDDAGTSNGGVDTSASQTFTITVNAVNDPPSFSKGANQIVNEDSGAQTVANWATAISKGPADEAGQTVSFTVVNDNNALFSTQPAISPTGTLTYTPAANANGSTTVTISLKDNGGTANGGIDTSTLQTFSISVLSVNDAPSFTKGANQTVNEDAGAQTVTNWATTISPGPNESGQTVTFTVTNGNNPLFSSQPAVSSTGTLTFTPAANANGSTTITVTAKDDGGTANGGVDTSAAQTFTITVNAVNDAPSFTKGADQTVNNNAGAQSVANWATNLSSGPSNESSQTLTFQITGNTNPGLFTAGPAISSSGTLTYTPSSSGGGSATITINLKDNGGTANGGVDTSASQTFTITVTPVGGFVNFASSTGNTTENSGSTTVNVTRSGDTSKAVTVNYATNADAGVPCSTANGVASPNCDFTAALGTLSFAAGETSKPITILLSQDSFVEGPETITLTLSAPTGGAALGTTAIMSVTIADDATEPPGNIIDDPNMFVRMHYHDFLNREADQSGLNFWTGQMTNCGSSDLLVCRVNVSGAFFLSIEFQQTGYLVERMYRTAYGQATAASTLGGSHQVLVPIVRANEFLTDTQRIGRGVVVLQPGWEQVLENNKQAYALEFVQTARFITALPTSRTPTQFVDQLNQNAGLVLSPSERTTAINAFGISADTSNVNARAQVLRQIAEDQDLFNAELNRAFVLSEYIGYLRRNPNDAPEPTLDYTGYEFWLTKLNQFNGDYIAAEMVKAFISSDEYRKRFGP